MTARSLFSPRVAAPLVAAAVGILALPALGSQLEVLVPGRVPVIDSAEVVCDERDRTTLRDRSIEADGVALLADGRCELELVNVDLVSHDAFALVVRGRARVTIRDSRIRGNAAVGIDGQARVEARDSEFWGGLVRDRDTASFVDGGGNVFHPPEDDE